MFREDNLDGGASAKNTETTPSRPRRNRTEGYVVECDGNHAVISAEMPSDGSVSDDYWTVGSLITIRTGDVRTIGMLYKVEAADSMWHKGDKNPMLISVELIGEICDDKDGNPVFAGVAAPVFPPI